MIKIFNKTSFKKKELIIIFLIAILTICTINIVCAADITISPTTSGGLKKTIETSQSGDTIYLKKGVYTGKDNTNITIAKNINIQGLGSNTQLDGEGKYQIFIIKEKNVNVLLKNLKFRNGRINNNSKDKYFNGGGAILSFGVLTISQSSFTNNKAEKGGAISSYGRLTVFQSSFTKNKAHKIGEEYDEGEGGAIYSKGNLTISKSSFTKNQADYSNAIGCGGAISSSGDSKIIQSTFINNKASDSGAIYSSGNLTVSTSTFTKNQADGSGGAISSAGILRVNKCNFSKNHANLIFGGGAIDNWGPTTIISGSTFTNNFEMAISSERNLTIIKCTFTKNSNGAVSGQGKLTIRQSSFTKNYNRAISSYGSLTVRESIFTENQAKRDEFTGYNSYGSGIYSEGKLIISKSTFTKNQAEFGGAIYSHNIYKGTISTCTFTSNKAKKTGGAINSEGSLTVATSTFTKNQADESGGAIRTGGRLTVSKSTFTSNKAKKTGGAIYTSGYIEKGNTDKNIPDTHYPGVLIITKTKFKNNIAGKKYGTIFKKNGTLSKKNVEITPKDGLKVKK